VHFGHTLGASGLLSIALAALVETAPQPLSTLVMPVSPASDGRVLNTGSSGNVEQINNALVSCRALDGSCGAAMVSRAFEVADDKDLRLPQQSEKHWQQPAPIGPLMHEALRRIAGEAMAHRSLEPPDVLLVHLEEPLAPPTQASIGGRLLPSAVLEMTPGFIPQLIARLWGYTGPALCVVGGLSDADGSWIFDAACSKLGLITKHVYLNGTGDKREIQWNQ